MSAAGVKKPIHVRIRLFGHLKGFNDNSAVEMDIQRGSSITDVIHALITVLGEHFGQLILDQSGKLHGGIEIVLNQEHLPARKIDGIQIREDSELLIMPMIEGGLQ
jgi:hypothetical protein